MVIPNTSSSIWARLLSGDGDLTPEAADYIRSLDFGPADHARMAYLGEGANEGTLTPAERAELDGYVEVGHYLALLQSKARGSLRRLAAGNEHA